MYHFEFDQGLHWGALRVRVVAFAALQSAKTPVQQYHFRLLGRAVSTLVLLLHLVVFGQGAITPCLLVKALL